MKINNNIPALRSLHLLDVTNTSLDKSLEKLSSGKRINCAADDAAGMAIAQKMKRQISGIDTANRNSNDGISLLQTGEGALEEVQAMLQRIRELAVESSNDSLSLDDRKALSEEATQLSDEIQRVSETTDFNGIKLLNGDVDLENTSTKSNVARIVSMSDNVDSGTYTFQVTQTAQKTGDTGGACTLFDNSGNAKLSGDIFINGEQVSISIGDTAEEVFEKISEGAEAGGAIATKEASFGNGKGITLTTSQYGDENELRVTGNSSLLTALGLDYNHFNPGTDKEYMQTSSSGISTTANGTVYVNGTSVTFANGDTTADIVSKLNAADISGAEFALNGSGGITATGSKPITIDAASTALGDTTVASDLISLTGGAEMAGTTVRCVPDDKMGTTGIVASAANINIVVNGVATTYNIGSNYDFSTSAGRESLVGYLNTQGIANTTFAISEDDKLISYNTDGYEVTIEPTSTSDSDDTAAVGLMGYSNSSVSVQTKLGNVGHDIQVNSDSLVYDNPTTEDVEGFPEGTTAITEGDKIKFSGTSDFKMFVAGGTGTGTVSLNISENGSLDLQIGSNSGQSLAVRIQNMSKEALGLDDLDLTTAIGSEKAVTIIDEAINTVSRVRSKLGAYENRLEHTIDSLSNTSENATSALSRIEDVDMAFEMSEYTKQNVLAQAGTSMLAQANQRPQMVLQLLQQ